MLIVGILLFAISFLCLGIACDRIGCDDFDNAFKCVIMMFGFAFIGTLAIALGIV